jgi:hypothetical protein
MSDSCNPPAAPRGRWLARQAGRGLAVLALLGVIVLATTPLIRFLRTTYHLHRAEEALLAEDEDEAGAHLAVCLKLNPDETRAHFLAGRAARCSGLLDLAEEHLEVCQRRQGLTKTLLLERDMLSFQRGEMAADVERSLWAAVGRDDPDSAFVLEALAQG